VHAENDIPWCAILDAAKEKGCDLIVMASHGRTGFSRQRNAEGSCAINYPVLVCRWLACASELCGDDAL